MEIIEYLSNLNWQTMMAMFAICWYFTYDIKEKLVKLDLDIIEQGKRIDAQGARIDRLYQMFCTLQKEMKDEIIEMKKEQYAFMKEKSK